MGFDFLRDRLQQRSSGSSAEAAAEGGVQRGHYFALIDEADSIMIDQARTPLLIAENQDLPAEILSLLHWSDRLSVQLQADVDFRYRRESRSVSLTEKGVQRVILESRPRLLSSFAPESLCRQVEKSLTAHHGFAPERDYVVIDGRIQIVDESTGRILDGRKWQNRLHQAIEVREKLSVSQVTRETARISIQSFLRQYTHLAGMTGTAVQVRNELAKVYGVHVARVPAHQPCQRYGHPARVFLTMDAKLNAIVREIVKLQQQGRAVLAGTPTVRASEMLSAKLHEQNVCHDLLHAKQDQHEAAIVARAGLAGSVIVATNMAGRGTDIKISEEVRRLGGLHVIVTEMHGSARLDRQLVGRAARRGDPGSFQFFVSFEDELLASVSQNDRLRYQRRLKSDSVGEVAADNISFFRNVQDGIERQHETQRRQLLAKEKADRRNCEELGLDPWLESFSMNQDDA
jgi:preprotein translocase subunit SecA